LGRVPPQAVEVEQAVIGAMLLDGRAVGRAIEMLDEGIFYNAPHEYIYSAMVRLYERSEPVDQLTVAEELKAAGRLDESGGVVYLAELAAGVASAANLEHHAKIVVDRGLSRGLIEASSEIANRAYEGQSSGFSVSLNAVSAKGSSLSRRSCTRPSSTSNVPMNGSARCRVSIRDLAT